MFGQVIIGLANAGKSTYCKIISDFLKKKNRNIKIINLDPGVEILPYNVDIDIRDIACVEVISVQEKLGPNESIIFAMEFLLRNISWLELRLSELPPDSYLLIDLPGQIELYTHCPIVPQILSHLTNPKGLNYHFTSVFLAESIHCQNPKSYISLLIDTLMSMLKVALPQVNILSKSSLLCKKSLPFEVENFEEVKYLEYLVDYIKDRSRGRVVRMYRKLVDSIIDLPWLSFTLFDCEDEESIKNVISQIDMANGYFVKQKADKINMELEKRCESELDKAADEIVDQLF